MTNAKEFRADSLDHMAPASRGCRPGPCVCQPCQPPPRPAPPCVNRT